MPGWLEALAHAVLLTVASLVPGLAVMAWTRPHADRAETLGTALALSPILGGVSVTVLRMTGVPWDIALLLVVLGAGLFGWLGWRLNGRFLEREPGAPAAWIAASVGVILLGAMYAGSEWWRLYSDAWTHEPIIRTLRAHGVPPLDPWYAGFRLQYAWLYHAWIAALTESIHVGPFAAMAFVAVAAYASVALLTGGLAMRLHRRSAGWTTALVLLGMNGAFVLTLPVILLQALIGATAGPEALRSVFGGVVHDADRAAALLRWFGAQTWFGNKFAGATPFALGLAALMAWLACLSRVIHVAARDRRELVLLGICALVAGMTHPVLLLDLAATIALWGLLTVLGLAGSRAIALRIVAPAAFATALGLAPAGWYFATLLAPSASHLALPFDASWPKLLGLGLCTLPALVFLPAAARALAAHGVAAKLWLAYVLSALGFALALRLPGDWPFFTVDKTSYLLWIPAALTSGAAFADFLRRRPPAFRALIALLMLAPPTLLVLGSRALDPRSGWRQPWNDPALVRLRASLPGNALLVVPPGDIDTPVFLARDAYDIDKIDGVVRGYDPAEMATRHALIDTLYRRGRLEPVLAERLEATRRPVYAIWPNQTGIVSWQTRTPGVPQRRFVAVGPMPSWSGRLPVVHFGEYAVSPLANPPGPRAGRFPMRTNPPVAKWGP